MIYNYVQTASIFVLFAAMVSYGPVSYASDKEMEEVRQLAVAAEKGPAALLSHIHEAQVRTPLIYSQWYVDTLAVKSPKRAEIEQARRDFGRKVLESLEATAPTPAMPADSHSLQRTAKMLLDLGSWFGEEPGYGNASLFSRLQDMATVPVARLIADLSYPETELATLVRRLVDFPQEVERNVRVLNTESPEPAFVLPSLPNSSADVWYPLERAKLADSVVRPLEREWYRRVAGIRKWQKEQGKPEVVPSGKKGREHLPAEFAFFVDDEMSEAPKPFTTLRQWDRKYHRRLFLGLGTHNIGNVKAFLLFRQKVGNFPTTAPSWWKAGDGVFPTPMDAAFYDAWKPFRVTYGPTDASAAETYRGVQDNAFYDEDTRRVKQHEAFLKAEEALKAPHR